MLLENKLFKRLKLHEGDDSNQQQLVMHYKITLLLVRVFAHVVASGFPVKMRPWCFCSCIGLFREKNPLDNYIIHYELKVYDLTPDILSRKTRITIFYHLQAKYI